MLLLHFANRPWERKEPRRKKRRCLAFLCVLMCLWVRMSVGVVPCAKNVCAVVCDMSSCPLATLASPTSLLPSRCFFIVSLLMSRLLLFFLVCVPFLSVCLSHFVVSSLFLCLRASSSLLSLTLSALRVSPWKRIFRACIWSEKSAMSGCECVFAALPLLLYIRS